MKHSFEIEIQNGKHILPTFAKDDDTAKKIFKKLTSQESEEDEEEYTEEYDAILEKLMRKQLRTIGAKNIRFDFDGRCDRFSMFVYCDCNTEKLKTLFPTIEIFINK